MFKVAVIGGGMTGLSAAFYLYREAKSAGVPLSVTLLESSGRLGGRVNTLRRNGFVIERGPDSFLARKRAMTELAAELGLDDELVGTNPAAKQTFIARGNMLHAMPSGLYLGVPLDADAFMATGLLSEQGKRRALAEVELPAAGDDGNEAADALVAGAAKETVGAFLERRFGREMVTCIFEPLLAGIYAGDLYALGLDATFPQFKAYEQQYGSVIRGIQASLSAAKQAPTGKSVGSVFLTFRRGLSSLMETLAHTLAQAGCDIRLGARVAALGMQRNETGPAAYRLALEDGEPLDADAVVVAVPAFGIADLLEPYADVGALRAIRYVSVANVVFAYEGSGFDHPLDGSGFLVPRGDGRLITASTWTSSKWLHTAPAGKRLIRCYVGRTGEEANVELSDEEMIAGVRRDLRDLMGLEAKPAFTEITRLRRSMPQFPPGHQAAVSALQAQLAERLPGVIAAGQPFGGVGLPDCVLQGRQAAESLVRMLTARYNVGEH